MDLEYKEKYRVITNEAILLTKSMIDRTM